MLLIAISYPAAIQIVWGQLNQNPVPGKNSDEVLAHLAGNMRQNLMLAFLKLNSKHCIRQGLEDLGHNFYRLFLRHTDVERSLPSLANFTY